MGSGSLTLIGIGPGDLQQLTLAAHTALQQAEVVIGYRVYIDLVAPLLDAARQEVVPSPIGREVERAEQAVDLALAGGQVAMISSGDIGIYAMASPVFEVLRQKDVAENGLAVTVLPGISAVQAAAARLGAPLGHDFCTISLSDLLTPWPVIERRLQAAAWGDFVIAFYNPRSQKRDWQLGAAREILLAYRPAQTPVALVRNVTRPDEQVTLTTLTDLDPAQVDMFTLVLVGNSQSYVWQKRMVTPRGYIEGDGEMGRLGDWEIGGLGDKEFGSVAPLKGDDRAQVTSAQPSSLPTFQPSPTTVDPITLTHTSDLQAVVIGGGPVGERKVKGLLAAGIAVRLISPEATPSLRAWAEAGQIDWVRRPYQPGDVGQRRLVFAATNQRVINAHIAAEAAAQGALCNVADQPGDGNFHVPAVHRQPGLVVAVSTAGDSPSRARDTRDRIAGWLEQWSEVGNQ